MRTRIAELLRNVADGIWKVADRIEPKEDIGEGWWSLGQTKPLERYEGHITFVDAADMDTVTNEIARRIGDEILWSRPRMDA